MSADGNAPPKTGWAKMVTELHVADLNVSLAFWKDTIGFEIAYRREAEKFVYLEHPEGQQIMLCQRNGRFETGPMQPPLGQGAMFQIYFQDISSILANLAAPKLADLPRSTPSLAQNGRSRVRSAGGLCPGP
jgi:predicted enzyme related to lactoylglutathione lyase